MRSKAGIANRQGDVDFRLTQVYAPQLTHWFGLACKISPTPTCNTLRGTNRMGRQNSLSGGNPRHTTHLIASHPSGGEEDCSKDGYAGSPPE